MDFNGPSARSYDRRLKKPLGNTKVLLQIWTSVSSHGGKVSNTLTLPPPQKKKNDYIENSLKD